MHNICCTLRAILLFFYTIFVPRPSYAAIPAAIDLSRLKLQNDIGHKLILEFDEVKLDEITKEEIDEFIEDLIKVINTVPPASKAGAILDVLNKMRTNNDWDSVIYNLDQGREIKVFFYEDDLQGDGFYDWDDSEIWKPWDNSIKTIRIRK